MEHSKYQKTFFKTLLTTDKNIIMSAVAGSGKTTTIVEGVKMLPKGKSKLFLAFNNSIVNELKRRVPDDAFVSTLHSFGFKCCIRIFGKIAVNEAKIFRIAEELGKYQKWFKTKKEEDKHLPEYCYALKMMADLCRLNLVDDLLGYEKILTKYGMLPTEVDLKRMHDVIELSNKRIGNFDFVDMIYQPARRNIKLPTFDYVFIDELQDLSKVQQVLVGKLIKPKGGRLIGVGDESQAIYGFAGADTESYDNMRTMLPNTVELPLSICYRCGKEIVKHAQEINPNIQYWESSPDGEVRDGKINELKSGDWVLCRNTKPLVELFLELMRDNKKAYIKGREIGDNLIHLIKRQGKNLPVETLERKLNNELLKVRVKLMKRKVRKPDNHPALVNLTEKVDVINILAEGCSTSTGVIKKIEIIFTETVKAIVLSTIHKCKGLENDRIFVLCKELIPSQFAFTKEQLKQESNLDYVMRTRAKKELIYITDFKQS